MKRSLEMTPDEILVRYRQAKNKGQQLGILAALNACASWEIIWILVENGIDPRSFNKVASLRNAYEKAKEKGLQLPAKKISDINAEITPEEAPEQNPEPDEKVVIIPETENETVTIEPDQSEVEPEQDEEPQISEEAVMLESYEKTIETLNKEIAYLQEKNKEYLEKIQELHESARRSKAEVLELRERLDGVGETIEKKDASIQHLLSENSDLKNSLHNREDDIFEFKGKLDSAMDLVRTREEKIEELENKLKHLKTSDFNSTIDGMVSESKLAAANKRIEELKKELSFYEDEKDGDGLTIAALKHENEELKTKVTAAEQYILNMLVYGNPFA